MKKDKSKDKWQEILDWVIGRLHDPETDLTKLAKQTGVGYWWLRRMRYRHVGDPGFTKVSRVFMALGGRSAMRLDQGDIHGRSENVSHE